MSVKLLGRIDIGFDENRGYAATYFDLPNKRVKGIKANSPEQLISRIRNVFLDEMHKRKHFPLESEPRGQSNIITPRDNDPLFQGI